MLIDYRGSNQIKSNDSATPTITVLIRFRGISKLGEYIMIYLDDWAYSWSTHGVLPIIASFLDPEVLLEFSARARLGLGLGNC